MDCRYCKYFLVKETKNKDNYGKCEKTELLLLTVQENCKSFKKMDE